MPLGRLLESTGGWGKIRHSQEWIFILTCKIVETEGTFDTSHFQELLILFSVSSINKPLSKLVQTCAQGGLRFGIPGEPHTGQEGAALAVQNGEAGTVALQLC